MAIIDAQVHVYERNHPGRPWAAVLHGPSAVTGDDMIAAMDSVGVDGAVIVSPWTMYRYDPSYAVEVFGKHPDRFRLVAPFDPNDPGVAEKIAEWAKVKGAVAIRIMMVDGVSTDAADPGIGRVLSAAGRHALPVNLLCWGRLAQVGKLAARHSGTRLVIDHLGIPQSMEPPAPAQPFATLPDVLALAAHDNIVIKITGACTLSQQPFPYGDIWDPIRRILDAYGIERCMWGTDWTRAVAFLTYKQGVDAFRQTDRLTESERRTLMGGALRKIYNWSKQA